METSFPPRKTSRTRAYRRSMPCSTSSRLRDVPSSRGPGLALAHADAVQTLLGGHALRSRTRPHVPRLVENVTRFCEEAHVVGGGPPQEITLPQLTIGHRCDEGERGSGRKRKAAIAP